MSLSRPTSIALFLSALLMLLFAAWAFTALDRESAVDALDREIALAMKDSAGGHRWRRDFMVLCTYLGSIQAMMTLAAAGACWQQWRGHRRLAVIWLATVASGGLVDLSLKNIFQRDRPPLAWRDEVIFETNHSFPSGHSMGSMIGYGMLGYAALRTLRRLDVKILTISLLAALVALVGFSRIYLRAHWFSDVIGGFLIGAAWLALGVAWAARKAPIVP